MNKSELEYASQKLAQLKSDFQVEILADWGYTDPDSASWQFGHWTKDELNRLYNAVALMAVAIGGPNHLIHQFGGVTVRKADIGSDIGSHGGEALAHPVSLLTRGTFSVW